MKAIGFGFLLASALSVSGAVLPGTWSYLNPLPSPNTAWGLHAHNDLWVVVGEGGLIATASAAPGADTVWTTQRSGTLRFLYDVGYGNGVWVVVGGEGALLSSPDGIHWTDRSTGLGGAGLESVYFGGNEWVAVGSSGTILSSTNGVTWIPRDSGTQTALYGVHHANGLWVAVGDDGLVLTSTDGVSWLPQDSGIGGYLDDVHYGDGRWVAVGGDGAYTISLDGVSWQPAEIAVPSVVVSYLTRVHHAVGLWVVTAGNGQIFQSPDAVTWSVAGTQGTTAFFTDVHYADGHWAATTQGAIYHSQSPAAPLQFAKTLGVTDNRIERVEHAGGKYVAGAVNGMVLTSTNGLRWESTTVDTTPDLNLRNWIRGVAFGEGQWILAGDRNSIWRSPDATTWERTMFNDTTGFQSVHYADNLWLLVGNNGDIRTSTNGLSWTRRTSGTTARIRAAFHANGTWVTVGIAGEVLTSTNAVNWSLRRRQASAQANEQLLDVEFGNGLWVAVGQKGATPDALMLASGDGRVWTEVPVNGSALQSVHYHDDLWVATGQQGTALTSTNGVDWDFLSPFTSTSLADSILVDGTWTMVGSLGLIAQGLLTLDPGILSILRQESGQVVLSWPAEPAGWEAWSAAYPQGPYAKVGVNPVVIGDRNQLTLPGTEDQGFFRLGTD